LLVNFGTTLQQVLLRFITGFGKHLLQIHIQLNFCLLLEAAQGKRVEVAQGVCCITAQKPLKHLMVRQLL
jgi:hypothetical protein